MAGQVQLSDISGSRDSSVFNQGVFLFLSQPTPWDSSHALWMMVIWLELQLYAKSS